MPEEMPLGPEPRRVSVGTPPEVKEARAPDGLTRRTNQRICLPHEGYGRWQILHPPGLGEHPYPHHLGRLWQNRDEAAERDQNSFEWEKGVSQVRQP